MKLSELTQEEFYELLMQKFGMKLTYNARGEKFYNFSEVDMDRFASEGGAAERELAGKLGLAYPLAYG